MDTDLPPQRVNQEMQGFPPAYLQDLQACEERFVLAIHSSNEGWWDCDLRTNTAYFSPAWKRMLGYEDDELPNNFEEWLKRVHADDLESIVMTALQQQRDGHHERKTLLIKVDALSPLEDDQLDHRDDEQVTDDGDQPPAMSSSELPRNCGSGRTHQAFPMRATNISSRDGRRPSRRCDSLISRSGALRTILPWLIIVT